jgi:hypothetical protein
VDHHDRRSGIARPDVEHVEAGAGDLDHPALRGKSALQDQDAGLCDQRQDRQRHQDEDQYHLNVRMSLGRNGLRVLRRHGFAADQDFSHAFISPSSATLYDLHQHACE